MAPRILDLGTSEGEWSASRLSRFTSREKAPHTTCIGSWVSPKASLDAVTKRKIDRRLSFPAIYL
jgi:hypothetical protein